MFSINYFYYSIGLVHFSPREGEQVLLPLEVRDFGYVRGSSDKMDMERNIIISNGIMLQPLLYILHVYVYSKPHGQK